LRQTKLKNAKKKKAFLVTQLASEITVRSFLWIACPFVSLSSIVLLSLSCITVYDCPFGIFKRLRIAW
jgi:hypothetical protein